MCGIFGVIFTDKERKVEVEWGDKLTNLMFHRGPDACGSMVDKGIYFGHRRLSIIDLHAGNQPLFNEDKSMVLIFNGEIYNFKSIRSELIEKHHRFSTDTDSEVIVHAYEEYGADCVKLFNGMFTFAIYNKNDHTIFAARDRLGIKPFYYYHDHDILLLSSEVKPIWNSGFLQQGVNVDSLDFFHSLGYIPGPQTAFKNVIKLQPGHHLLWERGEININRYWDILNVPKFEGSEEEASEMLRSKLIDSVKRRLMSDVSLGVFLSGGLDSSLITAIMKSLGVNPLKTFSVGYGSEKSVSELGYANIVAERFNTEHHEYDLSPDDFFVSLEKYVDFVEEPIVESAAIALYHLSVYAKNHATVILSGEGADELFAGYQIYGKYQMISLLRKISFFVPHSLIRSSCQSLVKSEKISKYLDWYCLPLEKSYRSVSNDLTDNVRGKMYSPKFLNRVEKFLPQFFDQLFSKVDKKTPLSKMLTIDTMTWLPDDLLIKADKMTMAASVELRVPFLDHEVVECAASLNDRNKLHRGMGKCLVKSIAEEYLPNKIIYRKKRGFPVPLKKWFGKDLLEPAKKMLLNPATIDRGYYQRTYLENIFKLHESGSQDMSRRIFSLIVLEMWYRRYQI